jgi:hypothetical protein
MGKRKGAKMQAATVMVDNPLAMPVHEVRHRRGETVYRMPQVAVAMGQRDHDQLDAMYRRRQIGRALLMAGHLYQTTWETAHGLTGRSSSDLREHVDGGGLPIAGTTDERMRASDRLDGWNRRLGEEDTAIAKAYLIDKLTARQIADRSRRMMPGKAATTYYGHRVRSILWRLAEMMGYA